MINSVLKGSPGVLHSDFGRFCQCAAVCIILGVSAQTHSETRQLGVTSLYICPLL